MDLFELRELAFNFLNVIRKFSTNFSHISRFKNYPRIYGLETYNIMYLEPFD